MTTATLRINCEPAGQPRVKATSRGGFVKIYTPWKTPGGKKAKRFRDAVAAEALYEAPPTPIDSAVRVTITLWMPRPKPLLTKNAPEGELPHTSKPDIDNIAKLILDGISDCGRMWVDDRLVTELVVKKQYTSKGGEAAAWVVIEALEREE